MIIGCHRFEAGDSSWNICRSGCAVPRAKGPNPSQPWATPKVPVPTNSRGPTARPMPPAASIATGASRCRRKTRSSSRPDDHDALDEGRLRSGSWSSHPSCPNRSDAGFTHPQLGDAPRRIPPGKPACSSGRSVANKWRLRPYLSRPEQLPSKSKTAVLPNSLESAGVSTPKTSTTSPDPDSSRKSPSFGNQYQIGVSDRPPARAAATSAACFATLNHPVGLSAADNDHPTPRFPKA